MVPASIRDSLSTDRGQATPSEQCDERRVDLTDLYERYHGPVYAYVRARIGSHEDAADITQHVFLKVVRNIGSYHDRGNGFAPWLFRIAQNTVTDFLRRRRDTHSIHSLPARSEPATASDPESDALRRESLERLRELVQSLPTDDRDLLALRFAAGLHMGAIASLTGKSEDATRKYVLRLLHSLRERYDE